MFRWLRKRAERQLRIQAEVERLIQEHGAHARHVLTEQIRTLEAERKDTKELWAVMREMRNRDGDDGLDTATRWIE